MSCEGIYSIPCLTARVSVMSSLPRPLTMSLYSSVSHLERGTRSRSFCVEEAAGLTSRLIEAITVTTTARMRMDEAAALKSQTEAKIVSCDSSWMMAQ